MVSAEQLDQIEALRREEAAFDAEVHEAAFEDEVEGSAGDELVRGWAHEWAEYTDSEATARPPAFQDVDAAQTLDGLRKLAQAAAKEMSLLFLRI
jgi:hypothetical protein